MLFGYYPTVVVPDKKVCEVCGRTAPVEEFSLLTPTVCLQCPDTEYWSLDENYRQKAYKEGDLPRDVLPILKKMYKCCLACGSTEKPSVDHVVPLSLGGTHTLDNIQLLCLPCNIRKGNRSSADYR